MNTQSTATIDSFDPQSAQFIDEMERAYRNWIAFCSSQITLKDATLYANRPSTGVPELDDTIEKGYQSFTEGFRMSLHGLSDIWQAYNKAYENARLANEPAQTPATDPNENTDGGAK